MNERLGVGAAILSIGSDVAAARCPIGDADWVGRASLSRLINWYKACVERRRQRRFLATLGERALRDIGLNRGQVQFELEKPCCGLGPTCSSMPFFPSSSSWWR